MKLLRDPVLHFTLAGFVLFGAFLYLSDEGAVEDDVVTVSQAQQLQLAAAFSRVWRRPPTEQELKGLIDDWVREELANREAIAMGLARDDLIIRRRLRQKYEAFMEQIASAVEATDTELQTWYESHGDDYRQPPRYSFTQLFFSSDRRDDAGADARAALASLNPTDAGFPESLGDALALPQRLEDRRDADVAGRFGAEFADGLAALPVGRWSGPVASAYGQHLVFIEARSEASQPPLESVRDEVLRDWRDTQLRDARDLLYDGLLERYTVVLEPASEPDS